MRMDTLHLYRVRCRGMKDSFGNHNHGDKYVVAYDPKEAYELVLRELEERDLGFKDDRELETIELIASHSNYPKCNHQLLFTDEISKGLNK